MALPTITPAAIKSGPGIIYWAPLATTIPTFAAAGSKVTATWTSWTQAGATDDGITYTESASTEDINVAESLYPVRTVTTGKSGRVAFNMSHVDALNWKVAMNGGTITVTGTGATLLNVYVPPLLGSERRVMLGFHSVDEEEVLIWPQVFNVGSVEYKRGTFATKAGLPVEFNVELPDPAVLTTPYKRVTAAGLAVAADI